MVKSVKSYSQLVFKKDGSINVRVRKDDGSFIHFTIEEKFITDHFNMYVDFIHLLQAIKPNNWSLRINVT